MIFSTVLINLVITTVWNRVTSIFLIFSVWLINFYNRGDCYNFMSMPTNLLATLHYLQLKPLRYFWPWFLGFLHGIKLWGMIIFFVVMVVVLRKMAKKLNIIPELWSPNNACGMVTIFFSSIGSTRTNNIKIKSQNCLKYMNWLQLNKS